jgi:hypothetical protein
MFLIRPMIRANKHRASQARRTAERIEFDRNSLKGYNYGWIAYCASSLIF